MELSDEIPTEMVTVSDDNSDTGPDHPDRGRDRGATPPRTTADSLSPSHLLIQMLAPAYQLSVREQTAPAYQLSALDHSQVIGDQTFYFSLSVSRRRSL